MEGEEGVQPTSKTMHTMFNETMSEADANSARQEVLPPEMTADEGPTNVDLKEVFVEKETEAKSAKKSRSKLKDRVQIKKSELEAEKREEEGGLELDGGLELEGSTEPSPANA